MVITVLKKILKGKIKMATTPLSEKIIAYLALLSGLSVSAVAVYYSVAGLTSIFSAAVIPIIVMGISLEIGKIIATVWLKQNWKVAPFAIKSYLCIAVALLMLITSMGIFGFLSKAHSDQSLTGDEVQSRIAIYDEKIKTEKENIDANRKTLKQLDEAVDQLMARSQDEKGVSQSVAIRKTQSKDRSRISQEITESQKRISQLNEERAPIAAEIRKVESEVGPIKYIAAFVYGNTDPDILERAVTWVIILIIIVFDPLALILLISSQISFQKFREREQDLELMHKTVEHHDLGPSSIENHFDEVADALNETYPQDDGPLTEYQIDQLKQAAAKDLSTSTLTTSTTLFPEYHFGEELHDEDHQEKSSVNIFKEMQPLATQLEEVRVGPKPIPRNEEARANVKIYPNKSVIIPLPDEYVQNEEQSQSNIWSSTTTTAKQMTPFEYRQSIRDKKE